MGQAWPASCFFRPPPAAAAGKKKGPAEAGPFFGVGMAQKETIIEAMMLSPPCSPVWPTRGARKFLLRMM